YATSGGFGGGGPGVNIGGGGAGMGGVLFNMQGTASIVNSTLEGNSATGGSGGTQGEGLGGAIFNLNGSVSLTASTIDANTAAQGGGAVYDLGYDSTTARAASLTVADSILYGSVGGTTDLVGDQPATTTAGANKSTAAVNATAPAIVGSGSGVITGSPSTANPELGPLQNNGGPDETQLPAAGSPALGAGTSCPATDQRGYPRPSSGCDLGAVELAPPTVSITAPASTATYRLDQSVVAGYACADPNGPGLASCTGSVPDGQPIDTSAAGSFTFTVTATSTDGLTTTNTVSYTVASSPPVVSAPPAPAPPAPPPAPSPKPAPAELRLTAHPIAMVPGALPAACRAASGRLRSCTVDAYTHGSTLPVASGRARRIHGVIVLPVKLRLTRRGRLLLARSLRGVEVTLRARGLFVGGRRLARERRVRLFARVQQVQPPGGMFSANTAELTPAGRAFLTRVRRAVRDVRAVRCEGHVALLPGSAYDRQIATELSLARARAACAYLRSLGLRARYSAVGLPPFPQRVSTAPVASLADNRYASLTITHG
ncbi:MAG: choice-of-anchor Q domain-containing protein, partial [Solirubrobacteraceae bacterium]